MPGPPPKRSTQRRRRNEPTGGDPVKVPGAAVAERPKARRGWHPIAKQWFESLAESGQAQFYEPSDWAVATMLAESMSRELSPQSIVVGDTMLKVSLPPKAASVAAWLKGMTALLATEGDRRRASIELQRPAPSAGEPAGVASIEAWRGRSAL